MLQRTFTSVDSPLITMTQAVAVLLISPNRHNDISISYRIISYYTR